MEVKHYGIRARSGRYDWGEFYKEGYTKDPSPYKDQELDISPETHPAEPEYASSFSLEELKERAEKLNTQFDDIGESVTSELWYMSGINDWLGDVFEFINQINALNEVK